MIMTKNEANGLGKLGGPIHGDKWSGRFLDLAVTVSFWSKDPSTKVGCILVDMCRRVISTGYNGFPMTIADDPEKLADREFKYAHVIHAETNALANATTDRYGTIAYLTHPPCIDCAKQLVANGVVEVNYEMPDADLMSRWADSLAKAKAFFKAAGVPCFGWSLPGLEEPETDWRVVDRNAG